MTACRHLAAILLLLSAAACSPSSEAPAAGATSGNAPIIVISIDTLRSDRLPAYGYDRGSTPNLDRFRRDAILFERAFTHCPQTLPAHASLFTGQIPPQHGVRDNIGYRLAPGASTMASQLRAAGYATGAAVSTYVLRRAVGIDQGFAFYDDALEVAEGGRATAAERSGEKTRIALERWISETPSSKLFAFLHLYDPHAPYSAPGGFKRLEDPYDNEIAYADVVLGRFFDTLRARKLYDDALIIVLSDHGEGLGEHGEDEHGIFVYREVMQVPLLVKLPRGERANQSVARPVGLDEVLATVLRFGGVTNSDDRDLLRADAPPRDIYGESYYSRLHFGWSELRSMIRGNHHYIDAPAPELYDYVADPGEQTSIADAERRVLFALSKKSRELDRAFQPPSQVDVEDQRKLAALGYVGSVASGKGSTIDPKTKVDAIRDLRTAYLLDQAGRHREAAELLQGFVKREPDIANGWALLGRSLAGLGRNREAIDAYRQGLTRFPNDSGLLLATAQLYADAGEHQLAMQHASLAIESDPVIAHELIARLEAKRGALAEAERHARAALAAAPSRVSTMTLLADVLRREQQPARELEVLDAAKQEIATRSLPPVMGLEFRRGEALLGSGRPADAEAAFRAEVTAFPQNRESWSRLAVLAAAQGRREEMRRILADALRLNPDTRMRQLAREVLDVAEDAEGRRVLREQLAE